MAENRPIFVISDLHMGDGGARDNFAVGDREKHLDSFLNYVEREKGELVIVGDLFEFWQMNLSQVVVKRIPLLDRLVKMKAVYVVGNHDGDLCGFNGTKFLSHPFFQRMSRPFERQVGGKRIWFMHGHEVDPICRDDTPGLGRMMAILAGVAEDWNKSSVLPSGETVEHVLAEAGEALLVLWGLLKAKFGHDEIAKQSSDAKKELTPAQNRALAKEMLKKYEDYKEENHHEVLIVGHTHQPGHIDEWYFNSGTWAEHTNSFVRIDPAGNVSVFDWADGKPVPNETVLQM